MEYQLNYLAIGIATVANFFVGFLWYTPLFGKAWAKENGFDTTGGAPAGSLAKGMIMNVIGNFFLAYVFASNNEAWNFVPGMSEMPAGMIICMSSFFTWLGFFLPVDLNTVAWERKSWKLFAINTTYHFVSLLVASTIITLMS
jgi:Protein of unknown function (DUF1761)